MRRDLPPRPHIDHLKKQAKDLLDAQQRGEPAALQRIRDVLPVFAGRSHDEIAKAAFALHDAQSAIAREYGFASWRELREEVAKHATSSYSEENLRATLQQFAAANPGTATAPLEVYASIRDAHAAEQRARVSSLRSASVPARLALLPTRTALMLPRSIAPFRLVRAASLAAIAEAARQSPSTVAVFAQRTQTDEDVTFERLHPIGCLGLVHSRHPEEGGEFVVLEALRPIVLEAVESAAQHGGTQFARIRAFDLDVTRGADEVTELDDKLRTLAWKLMAALPDPERARALLDEFDETELADLIVANIQCPIAEKAAFAGEPVLVERLRLALRMTERLAGAQPG